MSWTNILLEKEGNVGILTIQREEALNALNIQVLTELDQAIEQVKNDESIHVLIITGKGKAFVAGADISEMKDLNQFEGREFGALGINTFRKIELMEKPVIAMVNGYALGGGCELALSCDIRIASEKAVFGQPEVGLGITPGFSGTQRLPRIVGLAKAKELIFTANNIRADEALEIGLVNKLVSKDELLETTMKMAEKIASNAQLAVSYSKNAINRGIETDIETGISLEREYFGLCFASEDQKEGMSAFLEKRKPEFKSK